MASKSLATTRMSSKGQVVIPEQIRERLGLSEGVEFIVVGEGDVIILKSISAPPMKEFKELILTARGEAKKAKLKSSDIDNAIRRVRGRK